MFVDDIAVVVMMLPMALELLRTVDARKGSSNFGKGLMMALIFGAILGGAATPAEKQMKTAKERPKPVRAMVSGEDQWKERKNPSTFFAPSLPASNSMPA